MAEGERRIELGISYRLSEERCGGDEVEAAYQCQCQPTYIPDTRDLSNRTTRPCHQNSDVTTVTD